MIFNTQVAGSGGGYSVVTVPTSLLSRFGVSLTTAGGSQALSLSDVAAGTTVYVGNFSIDKIDTDSIHAYNADTGAEIQLSAANTGRMSFTMPSANVSAEFKPNGYENWIDVSSGVDFVPENESDFDIISKLAFQDTEGTVFIVMRIYDDGGNVCGNILVDSEYILVPPEWTQGALYAADGSFITCTDSYGDSDSFYIDATGLDDVIFVVSYVA